MPNTAPSTELDSRFSSADATATQWAEARGQLENAGVYWLTTVRPDGRPHVAPLIAVWLDGALYFTTGPDERKAKNLLQNTHCVITTGRNSVSEGLDLVVEGVASSVDNAPLLQRLADAFAAKYGTDVWNFNGDDGAFQHEGGRSLVFEVAPSTAFGFGRGEPVSQARLRF